MSRLRFLGIAQPHDRFGQIGPMGSHGRSGLYFTLNVILAFRWIRTLFLLIRFNYNMNRVSLTLVE